MGTTPVFGWPYPENSDLVRDGAEAIKSLGTAIEATFDGGILQVVSASKSDTFTTTSTSPTDVTGLSVSITPAGTANKVLAIANLNWSTGTSGFAQLVRSSTALLLGDAAGSRQRASTFTAFAATGSVPGLTLTPSTLVVLDSPATNSAVTYKIQTWVTSGTAAVNRLESDTDANTRPRTASTITLIEVAA